PPPAPATADAAPAPAPSQALAGRSLLVFIDDLFSIGKQRDRMLDALERDLKILQPEDRMAIVAFFGGRVDVLSGWTSDRAALEAARKRPSTGKQALAERREKIEDAMLVAEALGASDPDGGDKNSFAGARGLDDVLSAPMGTGMPALQSRVSKVSQAAIAAM